MSYQIYFRIVGYVVTIALQMGNLLISIGGSKTKEVMQDPNIQMFHNMQPRYLTIWTVVLISIYAMAGLWCDLLTLKNSNTKGYKVPKLLRGFRDVLFASIIWPSACLVGVTFWPIYNYDRSLMMPAFFDKVISPVSNHIMHTLPIPLAIWELIFQPRSTPKSHVINILSSLLYSAAYIAVVMYTYHVNKHWLYPFLAHIYGTIYFYLFFAMTVSLIQLFYSLQWPITEMIHGNRSIDKKQTKIH